MASRNFFATRADFEAAFRRIEARKPLSYVMLGLFDTPELRVYESGLSLPDLGIHRDDQARGGPKYSVMEPQHVPEIQSEPVDQTTGGTLYSVDMHYGDPVVVFEPGGVHDTCIMYGIVEDTPASFVASRRESGESQVLYRWFSRELLRGFTKAPGFAKNEFFWVGPDALRLHRQGYRLVTGVVEHTNGDVTLPDQQQP